MNSHTRIVRKWELITPTPAVWDLAIRRCGNLPQAALHLRVTGQDYLDTLMVSCYLMGVEDTSKIIGRRTEGTYEEER